MEKKTVTVKILGKTREYPMGITYAEIASPACLTDLNPGVTVSPK